jgi:hypothetical protein
VAGGGNKWMFRLRKLRWHQWARIVALLVLFDQLSVPPQLLAQDTAIVVVALGALFAPVPAEKATQ